MTEVNSLSIIDQGDMVSFKQTIQKISQWQNLVQTHLKKDKDYGIIPGTSKPTLYKPGAEKIVMLGKLRSTFEILDETKDYEKEFFQFEVRWNLWAGENLICQGVGLCSSKEDKYRYRWVSEKKLPNNIKKDNLIWREKSGKYGKYKQYRIENEDICSIANTILKMAKKRSLIDAALLVGSLSELFTQDVEDLPEEYLGNDKPVQKPKSKSNPTKANPDLATQLQKDEIYGNVICEKCGTRVYWYKCPKCGNTDLHIIKKGFLHSHLMTKNDFKKEMKPTMHHEKLTKIEAIKIWDWWRGNKDKLIIGERTKRESKEKEAKPEPTKEEKIKQAREIVGGKGKLEVKDKDNFIAPDEIIAPENMPE